MKERCLMMGIKKGEKIEKSIDLSGLPRKYGIGANKDKLVIDWINSVGHEVQFKYDHLEGIVNIVNYNSKTKKLGIKYLDYDKFEMPYSHFCDCKFGVVFKFITDEHKMNVGDTIGNLKITGVKKTTKDYGYTINNQKWYKYKCLKCGFDCGKHYKNGEFKEELWIIESALLGGNGCSCCSDSSKIATEGINNLPTTNPEMVKFFQGGHDEAKKYSRGSHQKIIPICPDCGRVGYKEVKLCNLYICKSIGCTCGDGLSYGHKYTFDLLKQLDTNFKDNVNFVWCKYPSYKDTNKIQTGEYDFVIESKKLIIEVDGGFHRIDNHMSGQTKEHSKYLDDVKDLKAIENGYDIIRISDEGDITENILNSSLVEMFDLSKIDWLKCEEFALSNRVKEACELKRLNPEYTTKYIGEIMNLHKGTIVRYLNKGHNLDWCYYSGKEEISKNNKIGNRGIMIELFKDDLSYGIFRSAIELSNCSLQKFNIKLTRGMIRDIANNKRSDFNGFTVKNIIMNKLKKK